MPEAHSGRAAGIEAFAGLAPAEDGAAFG